MQRPSLLPEAALVAHAPLLSVNFPASRLVGRLRRSRAIFPISPPSRLLPPLDAASDDPSLPDKPCSSRSSYPVQLRVYNIDRWGLAPVGGRLLRKEVDGIYHVAVAVHGQEYWFDHQVEQLNLSDVFFVRGFSPAFLYDMGTTAMEPEETEAFCFGHLKEKYNIQTYDCFYHNCHHFARDLCLKLTDKTIPQWLIDHGEQGLSELSEENAKLVRMVSNKIARIMMVSWGRYSKKRYGDAWQVM